MQKRVNFIVTDLDDTIWDWLGMWYNSFKPFFDQIAAETGVEKRDLIADFKSLHQKYGTTESSFIIDDLKSLSSAHKKMILEGSGGQRSIMHEYNSNKKNNLKLHDGILKTLLTIKDNGAKIIGFTESHSFYTKYRIKTLNLDGLFDCIYAPIEVDLPTSVKKHYKDEYWEPEITEFRYLAREVKKPNSEILEIILRDFNANKVSTIYIGDKLDRDIHMANQAGITSVYAKYGHNISGEEYELLKEVTHWTDGDVQRELKFKKDFDNKIVSPDLVLDKSFSQITASFEFYQFEGKKLNQDKAATVDIWKKVIDVQQHFNDLELRIRNYALTLFTATIAGMGLLEKDSIILAWNGVPVPASSILGVAGLFVLSAFWYMDRYWYHKLLLGAVKHGLYIENKNKILIPELGLTNAIGEASPQIIRKGKRGQFKIHSSDKFYIFYSLLFFPLILLSFSLFIGHQVIKTVPKASVIKKDTLPTNFHNTHPKI